MPTLDEIEILPKNLELAGDDNFAIADTSSTSSTLMKQVPAALVSKYSHAYLFNFDSVSVILSDAIVIVTKAFTGLGTDSNIPRINLGIHTMDSIPDNIVDSMPINTLGASLFNNNPASDEEDEPVTGQSGHGIRALFTGGQTSGSDVNLSAATAGQVVILVNIIDVDDYIDLIPAID